MRFTIYLFRKEESPVELLHRTMPRRHCIRSPELGILQSAASQERGIPGSPLVVFSLIYLCFLSHAFIGSGLKICSEECSFSRVSHAQNQYSRHSIVVYHPGRHAQYDRFQCSVYMRQGRRWESGPTLKTRSGTVSQSASESTKPYISPASRSLWAPTTRSRIMGFPTIAFLLMIPLFLAGVASVAPSLQVDLTSGKFVGVTSAADGIDKWLGLPFAQPPVGNLRFKAPVPITRPSSTIRNASQFGNACPQEPSDSLGAPIAEDCLVLNVRILQSNMCLTVDLLISLALQVFRPAGTTSKDKLPVLVWFYVRLLYHLYSTLRLGLAHIYPRVEPS